MENINIQPVGVNWWKAYRLVIIDEVAAEIPSDLLRDVLVRFCTVNCSIELCIFSGEDKHLISAALVLRCEGRTSHEVQTLLAQCTKVLIQQLQTCGFAVHAADEEEPIAQQLNGFFSGGQATKYLAAGFYPPEKILSPKGYYIPGRYSKDNSIPVSWEKLAEIVARHPSSFMTVQLLHTVMSSQEAVLLQQNQKFFAGVRGEPAAYEALCTYEHLTQQIGKTLYFVNMFCVGDELFVADVSAQMQGWKYSRLSFLPKALGCEDYLLNGNVSVMRFTMAYGHHSSCIQIFSKSHNINMQRFTHMASLEDITGSLPLPYSLENFPWMNVRRHYEPLVMIPNAQRFKEENRLSMVPLGKQEETDVTLGIHLKDLTRHGAVLGKSGCGKTTFALGLLYHLNTRGIPFVVFDPEKCEYRSLLSVVPNLKIYTPGLSSVSPIQLNPFLPPKDVTLEEYLPHLDTIFAATISMDHPLDVIFPQVIRLCYNTYGWRSESTRDSKGVQRFGMHEFIQCFQSFVRERYAESKESMGNIESGGVVRLTKLLLDNPVLFDTTASVDFDEILAQPTVFELDAIGNTDQKSLVLVILMTQMMLSIRKRYRIDGELKNLILIDEAHLLLGQKPANIQEGAVRSTEAGIQLLQNLTVILRAYGVALFFSDQSPEKLTHEILNNVNLKVMFRLDSQRERAILADMTNLSKAMSRDMVNLPHGCSYVYFDRLQNPIRICAPNYKKELALEDNIPKEQIAKVMSAPVPAPFIQCVTCEECKESCKIETRNNARFIAERLKNTACIREMLVRRDDQSALLDYLSQRLPSEVARFVEELGIETKELNRLIMCTRIQLIRGLMMTGKCMLPEKILYSCLKESASENESPNLSLINRLLSERRQ